MREIHVLVDDGLYEILKRLLDERGFTWKQFLQSSVLLHSAQKASKDSRYAKARPRKGVRL